MINCGEENSKTPIMKIPLPDTVIKFNLNITYGTMSL